MSPTLVITIISTYFLMLILISHFTSRGADSTTFFTGNRQSPWFLVAFGMIGASLSGVTFISVPGWVGDIQFSYFQMVLGYLLGYLVIGTVLMPLYYKLNLVSIYTYLENRFGYWAYKSGAIFFLLSRIIGSGFRLFLVAAVLQLALFDSWGLPFTFTVLITIILIWIYTFRGGIKTIVWTDTLQTFFMLAAVITSVYLIKDQLDLSFSGMIDVIRSSEYSQAFFWDWYDDKHFLKQFMTGAFIAIVMTGLDQDMMQKNLTCRNIGDAQKNMFWFSIILVIVNLIFLSLGVLLYVYAADKGIALPERSDDLFPMLALDHFSLFAGITFLLGITAAAYSSAYSALTALTTSFCIDILGFENWDSEKHKRDRIKVHLGFSILLFVIILIFKAINDQSVISAVFTAAGYTYGPILGLFAFGLFTRIEVRDNLVLPVCLASPAISYLLNIYSEELFGGYKFGYEILMVNGLLTFIGLFLIRKNH